MFDNGRFIRFLINLSVNLFCHYRKIIEVNTTKTYALELKSGM